MPPVAIEDAGLDAPDTESQAQAPAAGIPSKPLLVVEVLDLNPGAKKNALSRDLSEMRLPAQVQFWSVGYTVVNPREPQDELQIAADGPPAVIDAVALTGFPSFTQTLHRWTRTDVSDVFGHLKLIGPSFWESLMPLQWSPSVPVYHMLQVLTAEGSQVREGIPCHPLPLRDFGYEVNGICSRIW